MARGRESPGSAWMTTDVDPADGLFERARDLERLAHAVACGRSGRGATVVIGAPPGLGKSRLCAVVRHRARREGMEVLSAVASPLDRDVPFGLVRRLLDRHLVRAGSDRPTGLAGDLAAGALALFGPDGWSGTGRGEAAIVYGLYWTVANLSEARPVLVVVDDAQWADRSSLRFLAYLVERLEGLRVTVVVAARSGDEEFADALGRLRTADGTGVLHLRPLSPEAVAALVRTGPFPAAGESFCRACWSASGGNPFVVTELLRALAAEGVPPDGAADDRVAQLSAEVVVRGRLAQLATLPAAAGAVMRALAVLGDGTELRLVAALAGLGLAESVESADALAAAGIVAPGDPLRFQHPLVRAAVDDDQPAGARAMAHAAAARLLDREGARPGVVAAHLLEAPHAGDGWVVATLRQAAAEALGHGAEGIATRLLERAVAEPPSPSIVSVVLRELGEAQVAAGAPDALDTLAAAVDGAVDADQRARALDQLGKGYFARGRLADAAVAFDRAVGELGDTDPALSREIEARYVGVATGTGAISGKDRARLDRLLDEHPDGDLPAERPVLAAVALRAALLGEPSALFGPLALRSVDGAAPWTVDGRSTIHLVSSVIALLYADELEVCQRLLDGALAEARRAGAGGTFATVCSLRAWPAYLRGHLAEAIVDAELALQAGPTDAYQPFGATHTLLTHAYIDAGDLDAARRTVAQAEATAGDNPGLELVVPHGARGRLKLLEGDAAGALEDLRIQGRLLEEMGFANYPIPWRPIGALAALAVGDRPLAERFVTEERRLAPRLGTARAEGVALCAAGQVAGGEQGVALAEAAVAMLERSPARLELARALVTLGSLLRRSGARAACREPLARGRDLADRCGARALVDRAGDELAAAGARPRRLRTSGAASLTPSERRVATMAAQGMTNPQIAQALFVTPRTVEQHLYNSYKKLGIRSRGELGRALLELR